MRRALYCLMRLAASRLRPLRPRRPSGHRRMPAASRTSSRSASSSTAMIFIRLSTRNRSAPHRRNSNGFRNIRENPQVALVIDRYDEDWRKLAYVLVSGKARMLLSGAKHRKAVKLLRRKYSQYRKMRIDRLPMILIQPKRTTSWGACR